MKENMGNKEDTPGPSLSGNLQEVKPQLSGHREVIMLSTTLSELQWICKIPVQFLKSNSCILWFFQGQKKGSLNPVFPQLVA